MDGLSDFDLIFFAWERFVLHPHGKVWSLGGGSEIVTRTRETRKRWSGSIIPSTIATFVQMELNPCNWDKIDAIQIFMWQLMCCSCFPVKQQGGIDEARVAQVLQSSIAGQKTQLTAIWMASRNKHLLCRMLLLGIGWWPVVVCITETKIATPNEGVYNPTWENAMSFTTDHRRRKIIRKR